MWQGDQRHGPGVVVTQAGVCYQGTFQADKMVVRVLLLPHPTHVPHLLWGPKAKRKSFFRGEDEERGLALLSPHPGLGYICQAPRQARLIVVMVASVKWQE